MSFSVFEKNSKLLPAFCQPYPNEALSSWLTRLAFDNGMNRSLMIANFDLGIHHEKTALNIDRIREVEKIDLLSSYTNCSVAGIRNTTLHTYENKLFAKRPDGVIPAKWITINNVRARHCINKNTYTKGKDNVLFCPSCLSDRSQPVYYRKSWRLSVSFVCPDCGCYLREACPHCGLPSSNMNKLDEMPDYDSIDEYLLACGSCKKDISDCVAEPAPAHIIKLQKHINEYLDQPYNVTERYSVGYFRVIHGLVRFLSMWH